MAVVVGVFGVADVAGWLVGLDGGVFNSAADWFNRLFGGVIRSGDACPYPGKLCLVWFIAGFLGCP